MRGQESNRQEGSRPHARFDKVSTSSDQVLNIASQRLGNPLKDQDARIALAPLDAAQIGLMNCSFMRELLLRKAPVSPRILQIEAHPDTHIHRRIGGIWPFSAHSL